jgi:hypothetical protein
MIQHHMPEYLNLYIYKCITFCYEGRFCEIEDLMVVSRIMVVWDVISCGLVHAYESFRGTYCLKAIAKLDGITFQRT